MELHIAKRLPPLSDLDKDRLNKLAKLPLHKYREADVREEFLAPIIELLGYERGKDRDVLREDVQALSPAYVMLGSHKYKLDYKFVVWKQGFWLLEAKSAECSDPDKPPNITPEDVGQAFAYALHPHVDAPYYAVSNGWWFNLYDRDGESQEPILKISQSELPAKFDELRKVLHAEQITFHLKHRLLRRIEQVLGADVSLDRSDEFLREVSHVVNKVRPRVLENFRTVCKHNQDIEAYWIKSLETARPYQLVETVLGSAVSLGDLAKVGNKIAECVLAVPNSGDTYLTLSKLLVEVPRPVLLHEHINSLYVLAVLAKRGGDMEVAFPQSTLPRAKSPLPLKSIFAGWAEILLTHFEKRPELRFLWVAEALLGRFAKRVAVCNEAGRRGIIEMTDFQRYSLPEDLLATVTACPASNLIAMVTNTQMVVLGNLISELFDRKNRRFLDAKAKQVYEEIYKQEQKLIHATPNYRKLLDELGSEWGELMFFDSINVTYDKLGAGVCNILEMFPELTKSLPASCHDAIRELAGLGANYADKCCALIGKAPMNFTTAEIESRQKALFHPFPNG